MQSTQKNLSGGVFAGGALDGIRVIDLTRHLPGPLATQILCDMGAEVIKIEDVLGGDPVRRVSPLLADGNSAYFHALNHQKQTTFLDIKSPIDQKVLLELLSSAHILVEGFRPQYLESIGLRSDVLWQAAPELIICRITGYGQKSEEKSGEQDAQQDAQQDHQNNTAGIENIQRAGHDVNFMARAGLLGSMQKPTALPFQAADIAGGTWPALVEILAALFAQERRRRLGLPVQGVELDIAMSFSVQALHMLAMIQAAVGTYDAASDILGGTAANYNVLPTQDGHLAIGALEPKFWRRFCEAIDMPSIYKKILQTGEVGLQVQQEIAAVLSQYPTAYWQEKFASLDACIDPVYTVDKAWKNAPEHTKRIVYVDEQAVTLPRIPISPALRRPHTDRDGS